LKGLIMVVRLGFALPLLVLSVLIACETEADVEKKIGRLAPAYEVSATQLFSEYEANELAADRKYA